MLRVRWNHVAADFARHLMLDAMLRKGHPDEQESVPTLPDTCLTSAHRNR